MKIKEKGHSAILVNNQADIADFIQKIKDQYKVSLAHKNIIVDLTNHANDIVESDLLLFEQLALEHVNTAKKSFVIVIPDVDFNDFDQELVVVPTLLEAGDIIDMDEIQRELGF
ncbi:ribonuclease Z [Myroides sp. LJL116]